MPLVRNQIPEWMPRLWQRQAPFLLTVLAVWAKLLLSFQTLGEFLGQVPLTEYLLLLGEALGVVRWRELLLIISLGGYVLSLGATLVVLGWTQLLPERARRVALLASNVLLTAWIVADTVYFRYFHDFLSPGVLLQAGMATDLGGAIWLLLTPWDVFFVADFAVLAILWAIRVRPAGVERPVRLRVIHAAVSVGVGAVLLGGTIHVRSYGDYNFDRFDWSSGELFRVVGLLPFHAIKTTRYIQQAFFADPLPASERDRIRGWFQERSKVDGVPDWLPGVARGKNVIVVQLESFQSFLVGRRLGGKEITPHLNALILESLYFPHAYQQAGSGKTSDAELAANCSVLPLRQGSNYVQFPESRYDCLSETAQAAGYETMVLHGNVGSYYGRYRVYPRLGFKTFYDLAQFPPLDESNVGWGASDDVLYGHSMRWLTQARKPFYSYYITLSSHTPFKVAGPRQFEGHVPPRIVGDYVESIHYADAALGRFVEQLKQAGLWDESVFVVFGDHDNGFPVDSDPESYARIVGRELSALEAAELDYQVGLLIRLPRGEHAGIYRQPVGHSDLPPTLATMLGFPGATRYWMGQNAFLARRDPVPLHGGGFVSEDLFLAFNAKPEHRACYDRRRRMEVPLDACHVAAKDAQSKLALSETVVSRDLISNFAAMGSAQTSAAQIP